MPAETTTVCSRILDCRESGMDIWVVGEEDKEPPFGQVAIQG